MPLSSLSRRGVPVVVALVVLTAGAIGYLVWVRSAPVGGGTGLPGPGSTVFEQYVEAFEVGLAALDASVPQVATENLSRAVELVPDEPAGWADRGLHYLRSGRLPEAAQDLDRAEGLAPDNAEVQKLMGLLEQRSGNYAEAMAHLHRALDHDPADVKVLFLLGQVVDQQRNEGSDAEHQHLMEQILAIQPDNLYVLADRLRVAVRRSDTESVRDTLDRFRRLAPGWKDEVRVALDDAEKKLSGKLGPGAVRPAITFSNLLVSAPSYARDAEAVNPDKMPGDPLRTFVRLAPARHSPAAPDEELAFAVEPLPGVLEGHWDVVLPAWLTGEGRATAVVANAEQVHLGVDIALPGLPVTADGVVAIDWNNDKRMDLFLAGAGGLRFYQQQDERTFADVTSKTQLADEIARGDYYAALAADVDLDGDLDLLVSRRSGSPWFLRNNFDGTFKALPIFEELEGPQKFAWADFDHDGAPDAALLDGDGKLHVFANERSAKFIPWPATPPDGRILVLAVADVNDDGVLDLVALGENGGIKRISDRDKRTAWESSEIATWNPSDGGKPSTAAWLSAVDLDNNGVADLLASTAERSAIWLGAGADRFIALNTQLPPRLMAAADLRGEGRLDLLGLNADGQPIGLLNRGTKGYHWQTIRPQATEDKAEGDNRINSFGIGGEVELRTGTHVAKQPINAPAVHFGLGERPRSDVVRIEWPNGTFQTEFSLPIDKAVTAVQRLKGSCPFLFAWNGERFAFVTDFMWSTPLGMYINASDKGGFLQTTDWVKIRGDQLQSRDGVYELRVNASLWETHFLDHLALVAVDHPDDSELYVDERFFMEPTEPSWRLMEPLRGVAGAWDQRGEKAIDEVREVDGVYLDRSGRGTYQGVTHEHWKWIWAMMLPAAARCGWWPAAGCIPPIARSTMPWSRALARRRMDWFWIYPTAEAAGRSAATGSAFPPARTRRS